MADSGTPEHNWEKYYQLKPGDVFVEAGAFWGRYGKIASEKVGPTGKVVLIEASPMNADTIRDVVSTRNLTNVIVVQKAVGLEKKIEKFLTSDNPAGHHIVPIDYNHPLAVEVQVDTVPNILAELGIDHVDLFACDIENAEVWTVMAMRTPLMTDFKVKNFAVAAYHAVGNAEAIMCMLETFHYRGVKYEDGVVYAHA